jgi:ribonuclease HI
MLNNAMKGRVKIPRNGSIFLRKFPYIHSLFNGTFSSVLFSSVLFLLDMATPVIMYTDGACSGNPGRGAYAAILIKGVHRKELSAGFRLTTNNRMELLGVITGLEALVRPSEVRLHTDSAYIVDAVTKGWARKWRAQGWKRNKKDRAENPDLWERLLTLCDTHTVEFIWVKGHANNAENIRADALAVEASQEQCATGIDEGYERKVLHKKNEITLDLRDLEPE